MSNTPTPSMAMDLLLDPSAVSGSEGPGLSPFHVAITNWLLHQIAYLDQWGAWEWNLRWLSVGWVIFFGVLRYVLGKRHHVNWYTLVHAIITGLGGTVCAYLTLVSAEAMTGKPGLLGMVLCHGPLTSLHRVLPTASMGFAFFDLFDGLMMGSIDFAIHGLAMSLVAIVMMESDKNEFLAIMLHMEVSSIFLNLIKADFISPTASTIHMMLFAITFFLSRILVGVGSILWLCYLFYTVGNQQSEITSHCTPKGFVHFFYAMAVCFNTLNVFWFSKIIQKVQRKMRGQEKMHQGNSLEDIHKVKQQ